jgi:hypothetical protein
MKRSKSPVNTQKDAIKTNDFRVWCADCCIRIAPHEEQIAVDGQTYHPPCYSKHSVLPGVKAGRR